MLIGLKNRFTSRREGVLSVGGWSPFWWAGNVIYLALVGDGALFGGEDDLHHAHGVGTLLGEWKGGLPRARLGGGALEGVSRGLLVARSVRKANLPRAGGGER